MKKRNGLTFPLQSRTFPKSRISGISRPGLWKNRFSAPGRRRPFQPPPEQRTRDRSSVLRSAFTVATEKNVTLSLQEAARRIKDGGLLLYPTETFFGIGCRADDDAAVHRVFRCKKRSLSMPLPVILDDENQLDLVAVPGSDLTGDIAALARFWPGPLTLLLPAKDDLPEALTGGTGKIAARVSSHPAARALAGRCGFPIVSSSANISGRAAVTRASELDPELLQSLDPSTDGILDEPPAPGGGEASTIVEPLGERRLRLLREGALPLSTLEQAGFTILTSSASEVHA